MAEIICLCNEVFDLELREYLDTHPVKSLDELRDRVSICNKCMQCEQLVEVEISLSRNRLQRVLK